MSVGELRGFDDLIISRSATTVGDVVGDGAVEEERVLFDDAEQAGDQLSGGDVLQVHAIERDRAGGGIVETGDKIAERGFTRSAGTRRARSSRPVAHQESHVEARESGCLCR